MGFVWKRLNWTRKKKERKKGKEAAMLLSVCDMCVAFSNPECSETGQKKRCWKVYVRLVWYGQINLPWGVGVDCGEVKMTAEME
jgi:hypothetical protein